MNQALLWMHHYALCADQINDQSLASVSACIYVWDNQYFRHLNYSLNRLVFIYETLCELPVEIIQGDMISVLTARPESIIYVAETRDEVIQRAISVLQEEKQVIPFAERPFINAPHTKDCTRFSSYWRQVESIALTSDGGFDDKPA